MTHRGVDEQENRTRGADRSNIGLPRFIKDKMFDGGDKRMKKKISGYKCSLLILLLLLSLTGIGIMGSLTENPIYASGPKYTIAQAKKKLIHQKKFKSKYKKVYGIDVSRWDEDVDWKKVKKSGVEFAIIQIGYRGKTDGKLMMDSHFKENIQGAYDVGIDIGIYYVTQALNTKEARGEANYCIKHLEAYKQWLSYPVFIDIEPHEGSRFDKANLSKKKKTNICKSFCQTLADAGYASGVYTSGSFYYDWVYADQLEKYTIWMANYTRSTDYKGKYDMWQFTSSGSVNGIPVNADLDVAYIIQKPEAPKYIEQTDLTTNSLTLQWSRIAAADGYQLRMTNDNGKTIATYTASENTQTLGGLKPGNRYHFSIRAYYLNNRNEKIYGDYSKVFDACTLPGKVGFMGSSVTDTSVTLFWPAIPAAAGYQIQGYQSGTGTYTDLGYSEQNQFTVYGLKKKSPYLFRVRAYVNLYPNKRKYGDFSDVQKQWTGTPALTGLTIGSITKNSGTVVWNPQTGEGVEGYHLQVQTADGQMLVSEDTSEVSRHITGLLPGGHYKVHVNSYYQNADGNRVDGTILEDEFFTVSNLTRPGSVKKITKKIRAKTAALSWKKVKNASGYQVFLYKKNKLTAVYTVKKPKKTLKKLKGAYTVKVRAYKESGTVRAYSSKFKKIRIRV